MGAQRRHSTKFIAAGSQEAKETRYIAKKYFRLAAENGHAEAARVLEKLEGAR